jgi:TolB protein
MLAGWTPQGEIGVFVEAELHRAIYTVAAGGGQAVQVSPEGPWIFSPRWSSDGERIYFRGAHKTDGVIIASVPAAGGDVVKLPVPAERRLVPVLPGGGLHPSPDGKRIVISAYQKPWSKEEGVDLWTVALDGGPPTRLTSDPEYESHPCWSPDGEQIAFTRFVGMSEDRVIFNIYTIPVTGGEPQPVTTDADGVGGGAIAYSPDGTRIAFFSEGAIKTIPVGGGTSSVLVGAEGADQHSLLAWSPDGGSIAYGTGNKIWVTPVEGDLPERLQTGLPENAMYGGFSWSRDGKRIAFVAAIGGEHEFWLVSDFLEQAVEN